MVGFNPGEVYNGSSGTYFTFTLYVGCVNVEALYVVIRSSSILVIDISNLEYSSLFSECAS